MLDVAEAHEAATVMLCSGKIAYELMEKRQEQQRWDTAIVRLEQLYPLPDREIESLVLRYHRAERWLWVQEEPANMGAWPYLRLHLPLPELRPVCRKETSTTATGFPVQHQAEQRDLIERAFAEREPFARPS